MSLFPWLLYAHVLAAIVWLGGGVMLMVVALYARSSADPNAVVQFARALPFVGLRALTPAVVVLLVSGVWMILSGAGWSFSEFWVRLALGLFTVAFLIGALYLSRVSIQLERATAAASGVDLTGADTLLKRWLAGYGVVLLVLLFAVWDMVFKPAP